MTLKVVNKIALYVGLLGAFGMFVVANFQETAVITIHLIAAFFCFGGSVIYMLCHAWISHRMVPVFASRRVAHWRTFFATAGTIAFVIGKIQFDLYVNLSFSFQQCSLDFMLHIFSMKHILIFQLLVHGREKQINLFVL